MPTSRRIPRAVLTIAIALAASCRDSPGDRVLKRALRYMDRTRDAAATASEDAATADASVDGGVDAGNNAFFRQTPWPQGMIVEYTAYPHRFLRVHTNEEDVSRFIDGLKKALKAKDRKSIAEAMNYPLVVAISRRQLIVEDRDEFLDNYDRIMTPAVVGAIQNASASGVRIPPKAITLGSGESQLAGYVGMSLGGDRIWFDLAEVYPPPVSRYRLLIRMVNAAP